MWRGVPPDFIQQTVSIYIISRWLIKHEISIKKKGGLSFSFDPLPSNEAIQCARLGRDADAGPLSNSNRVALAKRGGAVEPSTNAM